MKSMLVIAVTTVVLGYASAGETPHDDCLDDIEPEKCPAKSQLKKCFNDILSRDYTRKRIYMECLDEIQLEKCPDKIHIKECLDKVNSKECRKKIDKQFSKDTQPLTFISGKETVNGSNCNDVFFANDFSEYPPLVKWSGAKQNTLYTFIFTDPNVLHPMVVSNINATALNGDGNIKGFTELRGYQPPENGCFDLYEAKIYSQKARIGEMDFWPSDLNYLVHSALASLQSALPITITRGP